MEERKFAKEITQKRIKGLLEEFIGGRKRGITVNHIIGQIRSAIQHGILTVIECQTIIEEVEKDIEANRLFPTVSKKEKLARLKIVKDKLEEQEWWRL